MIIIYPYSCTKSVSPRERYPILLELKNKSPSTSKEILSCFELINLFAYFSIKNLACFEISSFRNLFLGKDFSS